MKTSLGYATIGGMEILSKLFGSVALVKILRLFLFNPDEVFENQDVVNRARVSLDNARYELGLLSRTGFIKKKTCYKEFSKKKGENTVVIKKRITGWALDHSFPYRDALETFLTDATALNGDEIGRRLNRVGKLKLVIIAGVFIRNWDSRLDILVVGSKMNQPQLKTTIQDMEAEIGRELRYAYFSPTDFKYRLSVYDKLVRDVLDYPHEVVIDRIGIPQ